MFNFESGRKGPTGPGIYAFRYLLGTLYTRYSTRYYTIEH